MSRLHAAPLRPGARSAASALIRGGRLDGHRMRLFNAGWLCVIAALGLSILGVYAIDVAQLVRPVGPGDLAAEAWRQIVFLIAGLIAAAVVALPHYRWFTLLAAPAMLFTLALLVFLLVPFVPESIVKPRNGARGWIDLGPVDFQPSEVAKIAYVLFVAAYLRFRSEHRELRGLIIPGIITAIPVGLITLQPDLGSAFLFVPALFAMLIAAGARLRHLAFIVACAALAAPAAYPLLRPHQKTRIVAMVKQIQGDRSIERGIGFQPLTAQRLIGAGQATGVSEPAARALVHFNRLPERHNDMVYAVIVTRFGFLGGVMVLVLGGMWVVGALMVAAACPDPFGRLVAVGLPAFIAAQIVVNVGMNIGLLPIIGITLPFVSYGGSSLVTVWLMTGLVLNIGLHRVRAPFREAFEYAEPDDPSPLRTPGSRRSTPKPIALARRPSAR